MFWFLRFVVCFCLLFFSLVRLAKLSDLWRTVPYLFFVLKKRMGSGVFLRFEYLKNEELISVFFLVIRTMHPYK